MSPLEFYLSSPMRLVFAFTLFLLSMRLGISREAEAGISYDFKIEGDRKIFLKREGIDNITIVLNIKNTGTQPIQCTDAASAIRRGELRFELYRSDGEQRFGRQYRILPEWKRSSFELKGGDSIETSIKMRDVGFERLVETGDYVIYLFYKPQPDAKEIKAGPLKIKVMSDDEIEVLSSITFDEGIERQSGRRLVFVQQIAVDKTVYLFLRQAHIKNNVVTNYEYACCLENILKKQDVLVTGSVTAGSRIRVAFPDPKKKGGMVVLVVTPSNGRISQRLELNDDAPQRDLPRADKK